MAISPEQSLLDLAARTATADSDLLHINSGGTDYKETKIDFLQGDFYHTFANDTLITTQADSLATGRYFGTIASYGHQSETGVPVNSSFYVHLINYGGNYKIIYLTRQATGDVYFKIKVSGTWQSDWTQEPTRDELAQRLTDISSQFTWNTSLSAVNKGVVAYYDPYNHSVRGSFYINVSSSFASTAHMLVAPSGYRPSSNSTWIGVLSTTSKDTNFYYGSILTDGKFTQSLTSVCMGAYGQFEYKI